MHHSARGLILPFVAVICVLLAGAGSARAANGYVEVGFVGVPPPGFQNVLLNVQRIRINPDATAAPSNNRWQGIPVPPGIGGSGQNAELQIDLNTSQNIPQLFNTAGVRPDTYKIAELILDPNNPGTLVPNCFLAPPIGHANDGCINYPIQLEAGTNVISVTYTGKGGLVAPKSGQLAPLILQVTMAVNQAPTTPGGPYTVTVTLAQLPKSVLGTITGTVTGGSGSGSGGTTKVRKLAVTAEVIGTNTPIASVPVKNGNFTIYLPAAGGNNASESGFGTLYDLAVAGGGNKYAADRLVPLYPGQSIIGEDFKLTGSQTLGNISGTISDNCKASTAIVGATLQLLIPPQSVASSVPTPTADYCISNPAQCVAVATANTDNTGAFPLPGKLTTPAEFTNVPVTTTGNPYYAMEITAPGYDPMIVEAKPSTNSKGGSCKCPDTATPPYPCTASTTFTKCDLQLNTGYISGSIPIKPPNSGQTTLVQVFAEDHGTNNIESALPMPVTVTSTNSGSVPFTLNVPTSNSVPGGFDLFATTIDFYQGVVDPYQGHTIAVQSDIAAPAGPPTPHACSTMTPVPFGQTIECVGHGSVTGTVANANLGTSVVLSIQDTTSDDFVQIATAQVQNQAPNSSASNNYAFCAPADTYWLQTVQMPLPESSVTPSVAPTPEPMASPTISVTIPPAPLIHPPTPTATTSGSPTATPTPTIKCPTTCQNSDGSCPGICNTVIQPL